MVWASAAERELYPLRAEIDDLVVPVVDVQLFIDACLIAFSSWIVRSRAASSACRRGRQRDTRSSADTR